MTSQQVQLGQFQNSDEETEHSLIVEYDSAIKRCSASFEHLAEAHFYSYERFNGNKYLRTLYKKYYQNILKAFEAKHGPIDKYYYCSNTIAAIALTTRNELHIFTHKLENNIGNLIFQCRAISMDAYRFLKKPEAKICVERLYSVGRYLLVELDNMVEESQEPDRGNSKLGTLTTLKDEIASIENYFTLSAQRPAQIKYFIGMILGFLFVVGILAFIFFVLPYVNVGISMSSPAREFWLASFMSGSAGAIISVLLRMTYGDIDWDYKVGSVFLLLLGAFRPFIGAVFGALLYTFLAGGLFQSPIPLPTITSQQSNFYASMAFIAGFIERWVPSMLTMTAGRITPGAKEALPQ